VGEVDLEVAEAAAFWLLSRFHLPTAGQGPAPGVPRTTTGKCYYLCEAFGMWTSGAPPESGTSLTMTETAASSTPARGAWLAEELMRTPTTSSPLRTSIRRPAGGFHEVTAVVFIFQRSLLMDLSCGLDRQSAPASP
jgi:hypothetical protein